MVEMENDEVVPATIITIHQALSQETMERETIVIQRANVRLHWPSTINLQAKVMRY